MSAKSRLPILKMPGLSQVVPILAIIMEVCWSYTILAFISRMASRVWDGPPLNLVSSLALAIFTVIIVRQSLARKWSLKKVRWVVMPAVVVVLLLLLRLNTGGGYSITDAGWVSYASANLSALMVGFLFGLYLVWRGISGGRKENSFSDIYKRFLAGLVGIILVLVAWGFAGEMRGEVWGSIGLEIVLFFGTGLLALAIANLETLRIELAQHQEATASFSRRWLSMIIILVLAILGLGIAAFSIFSSDAGGTLSHFLGVLYHWFITGITYLLYPVGLVVTGLYYVVRFFLNLLRGEITPPEFEMTGPGEWAQMLEGQTETQIPAALLMALKWGSIVLITGLIIFFLVRALSRYWQSKSGEDVEEVHETLWTWKLFIRDLKSVLAWLFRWARRKKKARGEDVPADAFDPGVAGDPDRQYSIREIYRALLRQGRQAGSPRRATETPYEYGRRLQTFHRDAGEELEVLTEAYIIERYGHVNPTPEKVSRVNRVWRVLREKMTRREQEG